MDFHPCWGLSRFTMRATTKCKNTTGPASGSARFRDCSSSRPKKRSCWRSVRGSRAFQQQIAREREKFIRSQQEYSETLRDVYEAYGQVEQAVTELPLSRSWITQLNLPAVAWQAKTRILAEHIYVTDWLGRLEQTNIEQYENAALIEGGGRHGAASARLGPRSPRTRA